MHSETLLSVVSVRASQAAAAADDDDAVYVCVCAQNGLTALHLASKEGHVHVVAELLRRDADIDIATKVRLG